MKKHFLAYCNFIITCSLHLSLKKHKQVVAVFFSCLFWVILRRHNAICKWSQYTRMRQRCIYDIFPPFLSVISFIDSEWWKNVKGRKKNKKICKNQFLKSRIYDPIWLECVWSSVFASFRISPILKLNQFLCFCW